MTIQTTVAESATVEPMVKSTPAKAEPVGKMEIAARLGCKVKTVHTWQLRKIMPPPDYPSVNGTPAWEWSTILLWAGQTGHIQDPKARRQYRRVTGETAVKRRAGRVAGGITVRDLAAGTRGKPKRTAVKKAVAIPA